MNIYQHLFFLIPICFLFWFGVIRFNKELNRHNFGKTYTVLSAMAMPSCLLLFAIYCVINRDLPVGLYNWLGTLSS